MENVSFTRCAVIKGSEKGIAVTGPGGSLVGLSIVDCKINQNDGAAVDVVASLADVVGVRVQGCEFIDNKRGGISVRGDRALGFHIEGNTLMFRNRGFNGRTGIFLDSASTTHFVLRNRVINYENAYELAAGVVHGPIVYKIGKLGAGEESHPWANFAR